MKDFCQYVLLTLIAVCILRAIKSYRQDIGFPSSIVVIVALIGLSLSILLPMIEYVNDLANMYSVPYVSILWKSLAISLVSVTGADICRASDEAAIAEKVELLGKCELLVLSLPLIRELTTLVVRIAEEAL